MPVPGTAPGHDAVVSASPKRASVTTGFPAMNQLSSKAKPLPRELRYAANAATSTSAPARRRPDHGDPIGQSSPPAGDRCGGGGPASGESTEIEARRSGVSHRGTSGGVQRAAFGGKTL